MSQVLSMATQGLMDKHTSVASFKTTFNVSSVHLQLLKCSESLPGYLKITPPCFTD